VLAWGVVPAGLLVAITAAYLTALGPPEVQQPTPKVLPEVER
jgi:hypothetical protein